MAAVLAALALLQAPAPPPAQAPSRESLRLGERLSQAGMLSGIISVAGGAEAKGVVDGHPELTPPQRVRAQAAADKALKDATTELTAAEAKAFAAALTPEQLKAAVIFFESPAGRAYRAAFPRILVAMTQVGPAKDFKGFVTQRVCAEAQVCPAAPAAKTK